MLKPGLAAIGSVALLFAGSGLTGCNFIGHAIDPQQTRTMVSYSEDEARQAVVAYLSGVTDGRFADRARIENMSDGSVQLTIGNAEPYDLKMNVAFVHEDGKTTAIAHYNADRLAWAEKNKVLSTNLHRCLRTEFQEMMLRASNPRRSITLDLDALMERARATSGTFECEPRADAQLTLAEIPDGTYDHLAGTGGPKESSMTGGMRDGGYSPPPPAFGKPDARMGKPTMDTTPH